MQHAKALKFRTGATSAYSVVIPFAMFGEPIRHSPQQTGTLSGVKSRKKNVKISNIITYILLG